MTIITQNPPDGLDPDLKEYLTRMFFQITIESEKNTTLPQRGIKPDRPVVGKLYYFSRAIDTDITSEGYWGYTSSGWVKLG